MIRKDLKPDQELVIKTDKKASLSQIVRTASAQEICSAIILNNSNESTDISNYYAIIFTFFARCKELIELKTLDEIEQKNNIKLHLHPERRTNCHYYQDGQITEYVNFRIHIRQTVTQEFKKMVVSLINHNPEVASALEYTSQNSGSRTKTTISIKDKEKLKEIAASYPETKTSTQKTLLENVQSELAILLAQKAELEKQIQEKTFLAQSLFIKQSCRQIKIELYEDRIDEIISSIEGLRARIASLKISLQSLIISHANSNACDEISVEISNLQQKIHDLNCEKQDLFIKLETKTVKQNLNSYSHGNNFFADSSRKRIFDQTEQQDTTSADHGSAKKTAKLKARQSDCPPNQSFSW